MKSFFKYFPNVSQAEYHKYILDKMMPKNSLLVIEHIIKHDPNAVFCGSFSLILSGLLLRKISDFDVITPIDRYKELNYMGLDASEHRIWGNSGIFNVDGNIVKCFNLRIHDINIDFLYSDYLHPKSVVINFMGLKISVENPMTAVAHKINYTDRDNLLQATKHEEDLEFILDLDKDVYVDHQPVAIKNNSKPFVPTDDLPF